MQAALVGDVANECLVVVDLAGFAHGPHAELHLQQAAVLALPGGLDVVILAIAVCISIEQALAFGGVGVDVATHVELQDLVGRVVAEHVNERGIDRQKLSGRIGTIDPDGSELDQRRETRFGVAQRRARLGLAQFAFDRRDQPLEVAFGDVVFGPRAHSRDGHFLGDRSGDGDEGKIEATLLDDAQGCHAAELWHAVIADRQVPRLAIEGGGERFLGVDPLVADVVAGALQLVNEQLRVVLRVFNQ